MTALPAPLRLAEVVAADEVVRVLEAVLPDRPTPLDPAEGARAFLEAAGHLLLAAYDGDEPVGVAWSVVMVAPTGRRTLYLHQLEVRAAHRRRGIGGALVTASQERARTRGADRFWLSTGGHNDVANALYASLGGERKDAGDVNYWWQLGLG